MDRSRIAIGLRDSILGKKLLDAGPSIILLGFVFVLAFLMEELFRRVLTSNSLNLIGVEPNSVFYTERLAMTGHLYTDPLAPPFIVFPWGPLFPYVAWGIHRTLHLGTSLASFYLAARLAACLSVLAIMIGVGAILRFLRVGPLLVIIASLLTGFVMFPWGYVARPDSLYLALLIWAVFAFHRFLVAPSASGLLPSMALLLCAGYAKQTGFAFLPLLCTAGLFCLRAAKQRVVFLLEAGVIVALSAALAPPHFWQNSAVGLASGIDLRFAIEHVYRPLLLRDSLVIAVWLPCLLLALLGQRRWLFPTALLGIYALVLGTALGVKYGSDIHYYNEYLIFAIILIAASLPAIASAWTRQRTIALCLASALLCSYVLILVLTQARPVLVWSTSRIDDPDLVAIQRYFATNPSSGLVADLADNGIGVFLPTRIAFAPFDVTGPAAATGHFDLALVHKAIRSGTICYAVTRRIWATDIREHDRNQFPWWASPWAAPVLRDLLPQFEQQAEFGNLVLMRNPVCPTS